MRKDLGMSSCFITLSFIRAGKETFIDFPLSLLTANANTYWTCVPQKYLDSGTPNGGEISMVKAGEARYAIIWFRSANSKSSLVVCYNEPLIHFKVFDDKELVYQETVNRLTFELLIDGERPSTGLPPVLESILPLVRRFPFQ